MDNSLLMTIVIAMVAIVPAVWAVINQLKKDKIQEQMTYSLARETGSLTAGLQTEISRLLDRTNTLESQLHVNENILRTSEDTIDGVWKKMYEKPVIVRCEHCDSPNVITNFICTQCGAPLK